MFKLNFNTYIVDFLWLTCLSRSTIFIEAVRGLLPAHKLINLSEETRTLHRFIVSWYWLTKCRCKCSADHSSSYDCDIEHVGRLDTKRSGLQAD